MFIDNDFPKLLGAELYRPHPAYIVEMATEPVVVLALWPFPRCKLDGDGIIPHQAASENRYL